MRFALMSLWMVLASCDSKTQNPCAEGTERAESGGCYPVGSSADEEPAGSDTDTASDTDSDTGDSSPGDTATAQDEADSLRDAAEEFLNALDADQRDAAQFDLSDPERRAWSNLPIGDFPREGARLGDMTEAQRDLAWALVAASLSTRGMQRIDDILTMESIVEALGWGGASLDDYYFVVFDTPSATSPWAWQIDGHHLAMNFTIVGSEVTMAPSLWGVEPSSWDDGEHAGLEPLGDTLTLALEWANGLEPDQLAAAAVGSSSDPELSFGPQFDSDTWPAIEGLSVTDMTGEQRDSLLSLIALYVGNLPPNQAANRMAEITESLDGASVVWVGDTEPGSAIYYRIHGPHVLIEFDHVMGPNHIHSVYRDPSNDYGSDWLSKHLATDHAHDVAHHGLHSWGRTHLPSVR